MTAILNLAVYCRVSSDEQKTGGNIHRQIEQAAVEIQRLGLLSTPGARLIHRYQGSNLKDQYFTDEAYNLEEIREGTAFHELLELCRAGHVNGIYVDSIDRIFRSRSHTVRGQIMDLIEEHEVQIHTPSGPVNNGLVLQFMSAIGAEDKKQTLRKLHIGKKIKVLNEGRPPNGRAYFGYDFDRSINKWVILEEEAKVIRWTVAMSAGKVLADMPQSLKILVEENPQGVSDSSIVESLNGLNINLLGYFRRNNFRAAERKNPTGKLPRNWVYCVYKIDRYAGNRVYKLKPTALVGRRDPSEGEKEVINVKVPPIVSEEDWILATTARQKRACVTPRHQVQEYLLQGIAFCPECGGKMSTRARHSSYYKTSVKAVTNVVSKYYVCQSKSSGQRIACAHKKYHPSLDIDNHVWTRITDYLKADVIRRFRIKARSTGYLEEEVKRLKLEVIQQEQHLKTLDSEKNRFLTLLGKEMISEDDWVNQRSRIENEANLSRKQKTVLEKSIKASQKKIADLKTNTDNDEQLAMYRKKIDTAGFKERQEICRLVIERVLIAPDGNINIALKM